MTTIEKARKIDEFNNNLPEVAINDTVELKEIWDGEGETPESSYSYKLTDTDWIDYQFEIIEEKENSLETIVKITGIELL